jgi:hypothetical protein
MLEQNMIHGKQHGPETRLQSRPALTTAKGTFAMAKSQLPAPEVLRNLLDYDLNTGALTWRARPIGCFPTAQSGKTWNARYAGKLAGSFDPEGYRTVTVFGTRYRAHRVAWAIHHGEWPKGEIDHINHVRDDNRIKNLRVVDVVHNARNQSLYTNNKSGVIGVCFEKRTRSWRAYIRTDTCNQHLGRFKTFEEAAAARTAAEPANGYHPNHGQPAPKPVQPDFLKDDAA